jgi:hypothetical protein
MSGAYPLCGHRDHEKSSKDEKRHKSKFCDFDQSRSHTMSAIFSIYCSPFNFFSSGNFDSIVATGIAVVTKGQFHVAVIPEDGQHQENSRRRLRERPVPDPF